MEDMDMPLYSGTKTLRAKPMSRGDYNAYRGWQVPADEDPDDAGYLVEYTDGGKRNDERHAGYISWSPVDVFERAYRPVGTHIDRMKAEASELSERISKLQAFIVGPGAFHGLASVDQTMLVAQLTAMQGYGAILSLRLQCALRPA